MGYIWSAMEKAPAHLEGRVRTLLREIRAQQDFDSRNDLDQCPATTATIIRRLKLLGQRSAHILLLGDDDLLSLALSAAGARKRIAAIDLDERLLQLIASNSMHGSIDLLRHDLRDAMPSSHQGSFDEVFTDPPYTLAGQLLFVHRALVALRPVGPADLYLCASRTYLTVQELDVVSSFLSHTGFELDEVYSDFNCYKAPPDVRKDLRDRGYRSVTWLHSDLFHYTRRRVAPIPGIPTLGMANIYEYRTAPTS